MSLSRRSFVVAGAAAGGGLLIGVALGARRRAARDRDGSFAPNAFVRIDRAGLVTLIMPQVEMGQGTYTSIPMLLAEELEVDLDRVRLEAAPPDNARYAEPLIGEQMTGGSTSIRGAWVPLRRAGATARVMLVAAAARAWNVAPGSCRAVRGTVVHEASGRSLSYGALADRAAVLPVPAGVPLKDARAFRVIGTHVRRLDGPAKVRGAATFGMDVRRPGMLTAVVAACPVFGGRLRRVDDAPARAIPGVRQVVRLEDAVAVVAEGFWAAKRGLDALAPVWDEGRHARLDTAEIVRQMEAASRRRGVVARRDGDPARALAGAARRVEAVYEVPFLAHAAMEPVNCTVHVTAEGCDVWVGTQVAAMAQAAVARVTGLRRDRVRIHNQLLGGGFGRRLETDFIARAAQVARAVAAPVQVIWTREEDVQHDVYRPYYYSRLAAGLDSGGAPVAWTHRVTGPWISGRFFPLTARHPVRTWRVVEGAIRHYGAGRAVRIGLSGLDPDAVDGAANLPYDVPNVLVDWVRYEPPGIPTGWWRGVGPTANGFVVESFVDELAVLAGADPVAYRRALLARAPRARAVLELAAERAGWGAPLPAGSGRGVAVLAAFGSYLAQVVEVTVAPDGAVRVDRVVCAVDCGVAVNPDTVIAQMEGGIVFGLSGALFGEITLANGRVEQSNFDDYRVMRMNEAPAIEVHLVRSGEAPGGVGEPGTSCVMPALANAIRAATGVRIRRLPVKDQARPRAV